MKDFPYTEVEFALGVTFHDRSMLERVFDNCGLPAFVGDYLISFLVSRYILQSHPKAGIFFKDCSRKAVQNRVFCEILHKLNLIKFIGKYSDKVDNFSRRQMERVGNCFEALMFAMNEDLGMRMVEVFLSRHLFPIVDNLIEEKLKLEVNKLTYHCLVKFDQKPTYRYPEKTNSHSCSGKFHCRVSVGRRFGCIGCGATAEEAKKNAITKALMTHFPNAKIELRSS